MSEKPLSRLSLRQLLTSTDKTSREMAELVYTHFVPRVSDFRDLTRPVRRKSQYPSMVAFHNGLRRLVEAHDQLDGLIRQMQEHLEAIRDLGQRARTNQKQ
jgi:hypothetical protein